MGVYEVSLMVSEVHMWTDDPTECYLIRSLSSGAIGLLVVMLVYIVMVSL